MTRKLNVIDVLRSITTGEKIKVVIDSKECLVDSVVISYSPFNIVCNINGVGYDMNCLDVNLLNFMG